MPRITPQHWLIIECIFLRVGFHFERQSSSHRVYSKEGVNRPVIIPEYNEVQVDIIQRIMRTANMTRDEYFIHLDACK